MGLIKIKTKDLPVGSNDLPIGNIDRGTLIIRKRKIKLCLSYGYSFIEQDELKVKYQETGFGVRRLFECPRCKKKRTIIFLDTEINKFKCRECLGKNIYKYRTNIYDERGTDLIDYKINKLINKLDLTNFNPETEPPSFIDFVDCRPKYMRYEKFKLICRQLVILYKLRNNIIFDATKSYSAYEINGFIDPNVMDIFDYDFSKIEASMMRKYTNTGSFGKF